jgi:hypothetical protein
MQRRDIKTGRFVSKKSKAKNVAPFDRNNKVGSAKEENFIKPNERIKAKIVKAQDVAKHGVKTFVMTPVNKQEIKRDIAESVFFWVFVGGAIVLLIANVFVFLRFLR